MKMLNFFLLSLSTLLIVSCGSGNPSEAGSPDDVIPPIIDPVTPPIIDPGGNTPITSESLTSLPSVIDTNIDAILTNYTGNSGASLIDIDLISIDGAVQILRGDGQSPQSAQNLTGYSYAGFTQGNSNTDPSGVFGILSPDYVLSSAKTITYNGDAFGSYLDMLDILAPGAFNYNDGQSVITVNYGQKSINIVLKNFTITPSFGSADDASFDEIQMNAVINATRFLINDIQFYQNQNAVALQGAPSAAAALFGYESEGYASEIGGVLSIDSANVMGDFGFLAGLNSAN